MCLTSIYFRVPFRPSYCISNLSYVLLYRWQSVFEESFCLVSPFFACVCCSTRNTSTISYLSLSPQYRYLNLLENIFFVKIFEGKVVTKIKRNTTTFCWVHFARIHIKYAVSLTSLKMKEEVCQ